MELIKLTNPDELTKYGFILDVEKWREAKMAMPIPYRTLCVKTKHLRIHDMCLCGGMREPLLKRIGSVTSNEELYMAVAGLQRVVVVGHGFPLTEYDTFVWTGSPDEFKNIWEGD